MSSISLRQDVIDSQSKFSKQVNSLGKKISFLSFKRTFILENLQVKCNGNMVPLNYKDIIAN